MIKYAGVPQLGDYVIINNKPENIRMVTTIVMNVDTAVKYLLDNNSIIGFEQENLTRVKPSWNVGELVRYKGKVYKVQNVTVKNYKFVYVLDNKNDWITEDKLEYPNDISQRFKYGMKVKVNNFVEEDMRCWHGVTGMIDFFTCATVHFIPDCGYNTYSMNWEAIDIVEEKIEPYNAELICINGAGAWKKGELAKVRDNHFCFIGCTGSMCYDEEKVYNIDDVNNLFGAVRFMEIKETIGDKTGWNGKFYVVENELSENTALKGGNVYVVKEGILNVGGYSFEQIFTSFEEIQKRFNYITLIEVKENK